MFNALTIFRIILVSNARDCIDKSLLQIDPFHFSKAKLSFLSAYQTDKYVIKTILLILFLV